ncbi:MAG: hypothetical protein ABI995_00800 [Acidobacteriota bacterium]
MHRWLLLLLTTLPVFGIDLWAGPQHDVWVAFRFDSDRVLFYTERLVDPMRQQTTLEQATGRSGPHVPTRYGGGGYLLPLTAERLATFQPDNEPSGGGERVSLGQTYTLWLGAAATIQARTEEYLEQWGSENPIVRVAVLARVSAPDLPAFRAAPDFFLISRVSKPKPPEKTNLRTFRGTLKTANRFTGMGRLVMLGGESGFGVSS